MNTNKIAELNDKLRQNLFNPGKDKVILTQGVSNLPFDEQLRILIKVKLFNNFNAGNDVYQEHDFGMVEHSDLKYSLKLTITIHQWNMRQKIQQTTISLFGF